MCMHAVWRVEWQYNGASDVRDGPVLHIIVCLKILHSTLWKTVLHPPNMDIWKEWVTPMSRRLLVLTKVVGNVMLLSNMETWNGGNRVPPWLEMQKVITDHDII